MSQISNREVAAWAQLRVLLGYVCGLYCSNVLSEYCVIYRNLSVAATGVCVWPVLQQPRIVISYQN